MRFGIIGAGNMANAIISGILKKEILPKEEIICSSPTEDVRKKIEEKYGVLTTPSNLEVVHRAGIVLLAVKPQVAEQVIAEIRDDVQNEQVVISIIAGKTIEWFEQKFERPIKLIRTMPNTPALVGEGMTGVCPSKHITGGELVQAMQILNAFGKAEVVPESLMNAVCAVSASSPAYVFMMIEAMADGAVHLGMPRDKAYRFAAQAVMGSAKMVLETGLHPAELKDRVTSPGGTTIEGVRVLEDAGFRSAIIEAMDASAEAASSL